jgi:Phage protein (N4 Gp49/phage Sf6 gene 66) family
MTNRDAVKPFIWKVDYQRIGLRTTICLITCRNGFEIAGYAAVADYMDFDSEAGMQWAYEDALEKLILYATFHLMEIKDEKK